MNCFQSFFLPLLPTSKCIVAWLMWRVRLPHLWTTSTPALGDMLMLSLDSGILTRLHAGLHLASSPLIFACALGLSGGQADSASASKASADLASRLSMHWRPALNASSVMAARRAASCSVSSWLESFCTRAVAPACACGFTARGGRRKPALPAGWGNTLCCAWNNDLGWRPAWPAFQASAAPRLLLLLFPPIEPGHHQAMTSLTCLTPEFNPKVLSACT